MTYRVAKITTIENLIMCVDAEAHADEAAKKNYYQKYVKK